jgi:hypothetical protein
MSAAGTGVCCARAVGSLQAEDRCITLAHATVRLLPCAIRWPDTAPPALWRLCQTHHVGDAAAAVAWRWPGVGTSAPDLRKLDGAGVCAVHASRTAPGGDCATSSSCSVACAEAQRCGSPEFFGSSSCSSRGTTQRRSWAVCKQGSHLLINPRPAAPRAGGRTW